jgi:hypothetical protein
MQPPYAPNQPHYPQTGPEQPSPYGWNPPAGDAPATQHWDATEVIGAAWRKVSANMGMLVGGVFLMGLIMVPFAYAPIVLVLTQTVMPNSAEYFGVTMVNSLIQAALGAYLSVGMTRIAIEVVRGRTPSFGMLFAGKGFGRALTLQLLWSGIMLVGNSFSLIGALTETPLLAMGTIFWYAIVAVPMIFLWLRWSLAPALFVDTDLGFMAGLRRSTEMTQGRRLDIFLAMFLGGLVALAGALACGVGALFTVPIYMTILPVIYCRMLGQDGALMAPQHTQYPQPPVQQYQGLPPVGGFGG